MITRTFESSSSSAVYTAKFDPATGESSCTCPGWRFKKGTTDRTCRHVRELAIARIESPFVAAVREDEAESARRNAATDNPPKPMLASAMTRGTLADYCSFEWVLEEKFDGARVLVSVESVTEPGPGNETVRVIAWSRPRAGKAALRRELPVDLCTELAHLPNGLYDGELIVPGGKCWDVTRLENRATLAMMFFDVVELLGQSVTSLTYAERHALLVRAVEVMGVDASRVLVSPSQPVSVEAVHAIWSRGGEGAIVKRVASTYQPGRRSADWVKVKRIGSAVLTITGFEVGKSGPHGVTKLRADDGRETTVKTKDNATMAAIARNPAAYVGRRLVIAFNELTPDGSFRHGIWDHLAGEGE